jgi:hypothetical protein
MSHCDPTLRVEDLELLEMLGTAAMSDDTVVPFECRPLGRWPFTWLLHPNLPGAVRMTDSESCARLEAAGFIAYTAEEFAPHRRYAALIDDGWNAFLKRRDQRCRWRRSEHVNDHSHDAAGYGGPTLA